MRDPTRGGVGVTLNEMVVDRERPVHARRGAGFRCGNRCAASARSSASTRCISPTREGGAIVAGDAANAIVAAGEHPYGREAAISRGAGGRVRQCGMRTLAGGVRTVDYPWGTSSRGSADGCCTDLRRGVPACGRRAADWIRRNAEAPTPSNSSPALRGNPFAIPRDHRAACLQAMHLVLPERDDPRR